MEDFDSSFTLKIEKEVEPYLVGDEEIIFPVATTRGSRRDPPAHPIGDESDEPCSRVQTNTSGAFDVLEIEGSPTARFSEL
jgi:hypothetical protein